MKHFTIIIDNGHGKDTAGKRSPDGILQEWAWNRDCAAKIVETLKCLGYDVVLLVPEDKDISLQERCDRINTICLERGRSNCILISVHANAAGMGDWMNATGWSVWTSPGQTQADVIATMMYERAVQTWGANRCRKEMSDGDPDYEKRFFILIHTLCPAVLVENFFYDNKKDYTYLCSPASIYECADVMCKGVIDYIKSIEK